VIELSLKEGIMSQILIIMQGQSGSGKSTIAKQFAVEYSAEICSTDDFFAENDEYKFDFKLLAYNHKRNQEKAEKLMREGKSVIIDNTNIHAWEASPYVLVAKELGIATKYVRATGNYTNVHGVPAYKVEQMRKQLEELTDETVLNSHR
jgi:predicted kinase